MKTRIVEIWQYLAQQDSIEKGFVKTLVDPSIQIPVYLAIVFPKRDRAFLIDLPENTRDLPGPFAGKGIRLDVLFLEESQIHGSVMLTLTDSAFSEVFDILLDDCLNAIAAGSSKAACLRIFIDRLNTWRKLLETYSESGLSSSAQQGLFGELIILLRLLKSFPKKTLELVTAWQGPDKFHQDFQYSNWAIEVKTTTGVNVITIANKNQLSSVGLNYLYLWHVLLDRYKDQGATLNDMVAEVKSHICYPIEAIKLFNIRLAASGYYAHQSLLYKGTGYFIRQEKLYNVKDSFPALTAWNIPIGINEVKYTLDLSACSAFLIPEETIYPTLEF